MRRLRTFAFAVAVPLILGLCVWMPLAVATETTGTFKTIGGGFNGGTVPNATVFSSGIVTFGTAQDAANSIMFNETAGCITFEGSSAEANEVRLCTQNPTGDYVVNIPLGGTTTDTLATILQANNFTATNTFAGIVLSGGGSVGAVASLSTGGGLGGRTELTPDGPILYTGSLSNSMHMEEATDATFDFNNGPCGTTACTHPNLIVHAATQNITEYQSLSYYGLAGQALKTLTESSATAVAAVSVASDAATGGVIGYTVFASDGTGQQARFGEVRFSATAEGTTVTCNVFGVDQGPVGVGGPTANPDQTEDGSGIGSLTTGTLTYAWTKTAGTNTCTFNLNAVSSLTQTTLQVKYRVDLFGPGLITPQ